MNDTQRKAITDLRLKGCSYSQISIKVGLSENTIKTFCRRNNLKAEDIANAIGPKEGVCECCGKPTVLIEGKKPKRFCSSSCRNKWWNSNLDKVNKKAKDYDCLVYYGVLTTTTMGQFLSLLFVSRYEDEWEDDRRELKEGYPYAYVWNREEEFGEIGSIQIKMEQGGLVRVA